ncbi:hypothetical protein SAMN02745898_1011013 [Streptomyces sp. 136MFCol5.1]|nr:hypothetical protein SAMN02745898_1011013 [Streptomyces sp. 136MFCol5.1]
MTDIHGKKWELLFTPDRTGTPQTGRDRPEVWSKHGGDGAGSTPGERLVDRFVAPDQVQPDRFHVLPDRADHIAHH